MDSFSLFRYSFKKLTYICFTCLSILSEPPPPSKKKKITKNKKPTNKPHKTKCYMSKTLHVQEIISLSICLFQICTCTLALFFEYARYFCYQVCNYSD